MTDPRNYDYYVRRGHRLANNRQLQQPHGYEYGEQHRAERHEQLAATHTAEYYGFWRPT